MKKILFLVLMQFFSVQVFAQKPTVGPEQLVERTNRIMENIYKGIYELKNSDPTLADFNSGNLSNGYMAKRDKNIVGGLPWELAVISYLKPDIFLQFYFVAEMASGHPCFEQKLMAWKDPKTGQWIGSNENFGFHIKELGLFLYCYVKFPNPEIGNKTCEIIKNSLAGYKIEAISPSNENERSADYGLEGLGYDVNKRTTKTR